jgi:hypothetical protein
MSFLRFKEHGENNYLERFKLWETISTMSGLSAFERANKLKKILRGVLRGSFIK